MLHHMLKAACEYGFQKIMYSTLDVRFPGVSPIVQHDTILYTNQATKNFEKLRFVYPRNLEHRTEVQC